MKLHRFYHHDDNPQLIELIDYLKDWHQSTLNQCQQIIEKKDGHLNVKATKQLLAPNSIEITYFQLGMEFAMEQFMPFPVTVLRSPVH